MKLRPAITTILLVVVFVVVVAVAGVAYVFVFASPSSPGAKTTTSTLRIGTTTSGAPTTTVTVGSLSTGTTGLTYYSGSFNYNIPAGPSGVRSLPNGTAQYYNSTEAASGTFTFFIAADNFSGRGTGHGTITITTRGFCTGSQTIPYTFIVPDATTVLNGNLTVFFANPVPANYSVPLTCTGSMTGVSTANNPWSYLAEYPGEFSISLASLPASEVFHGTPSAIFTWGYSIKQAS
jgi:hypothetical protein